MRPSISGLSCYLMAWLSELLDDDDDDDDHIAAGGRVQYGSTAIGDAIPGPKRKSRLPLSCRNPKLYRPFRQRGCCWAVKGCEGLQCA